MSIYYSPRTQAFTTDGLIAPGAKLYFYAAGTSTLQATYSDVDLAIANTNPVVADSTGLFGPIFLSSSDYKVVLQDASGVTLWTQDDVSGEADAADLTYTQGGTGSVARTIRSRLQDVLSVKDFGAVGDGATDDTAAFRAAFAAALAAGGSQTHFTTYDIDIPVVHVPSGTYNVNLTSASLLTGSASKMGVWVKGDGEFASTIRVTAGTNTLFYNDDDFEYFGCSDISLIDVAGTSRAVYCNSTGVAKHPKFDRVYFSGFATAIELQGTGNADHLRLDNCSLDNIPASGFGVIISNAQSVAHVITATQVRECRGTALWVDAGGALAWYGGSITMRGTGRFANIVGTGANIGAQNGEFNFHDLKFELNTEATVDPDILNLDAASVVTLNGGLYTQDGRTTTTDPVVTIGRGQLVCTNVKWGANHHIVVNSADNGYATQLSGDVIFRDSFLYAQAQDFIAINAPPTPTTWAGSIARAVISGCYGDDKEPRDVVLNHDKGFSALAAPIKRAIYRSSANSASGLPDNTGFTMQLPLGATVINVGVRHTSGSAGTYTYVITDGDANTLHTTAGLAETDNVIDESGPLSPPVVCDDDTTRAFFCDNTGTNLVQVGYVYVDYI